MKITINKNGKFVSEIDDIASAITQDVSAVEQTILRDATGTLEIAATTFVSALAVSAPSLLADTNWADLKIAGTAVVLSAATAAIAAAVKYVRTLLPKGTPNA